MARPPLDPRWIRDPSDERAVAEGCRFDEGAGRFVCDFIGTFCRQSKGRWAGEPIALLDWERDFVMRLFGWRRPDGTRRYRRAYVEVAKKNGKSTLISALCIVLLVADGEPAAEVYLNAVDRDQASIVFDEAGRMVKASPDLSSRLEVIDSKKRIVYPAGNGVVRANSAEAGKQDGLNPSGVIFDELHRQPDRRLWGLFEYACGAREQPLTISITTAGEAEDGVWFEQRQYSERVAAGVIPDTTHLGIIYRALPEDDIDDPATWRKANPSLGHTIREEDFARELAEAKLDPAKLANFKRLKLNIVARGATQFIDLPAWDACAGPPILAADEVWYGGLDLSETEDLSAFALVAGDVEDGFDVLVRFWLPEANIRRLEERHRLPYRAWADMGLITLTPGRVIDYAFIRKAINDLAGDRNLALILADPFNATKLTVELREQDGLPVESIRQGFLSLSAPTKELKRLAISGRLRHGGHPILRAHASNAVTVQDAAGNLKLSKPQSRKKIDGMAALVNAIAGATGGHAGDGGPSVYDSGGIFTLSTG